MHEDVSNVHLKFDYGLENNIGIRYVYNVIKKNLVSLLSGAGYFRDLLGPVHMSPVNRVGSVSEISPRHSFLYKNFDVFI